MDNGAANNPVNLTTVDATFALGGGNAGGIALVRGDAMMLQGCHYHDVQPEWPRLSLRES